MKAFFTPYLVAEISALATALYYLRGEGHSAWGWHRWFLTAVLLSELAGVTLSSVFHQPNHGLYNAMIPAHASFTGWFLFTFICRLQPLSRNWLIAWGMLFGGGYSYESWQGGFRQFSIHAFRFMGLSFVAAAIYYYALLIRDRRPAPETGRADLWWVNGVFCFYLGRQVLDTFLTSLFTQPYRVGGVYVSVLLNGVLTTLFYSIWMYAFYMQHRARKYSGA